MALGTDGILASLAACRTQEFQPIDCVAAIRWGVYPAKIVLQSASTAAVCLLSRLGWSGERRSPCVKQGEGRASLHVPGHGHKAPLAPHLVEASQQELAPASGAYMVKV